MDITNWEPRTTWMELAETSILNWVIKHSGGGDDSRDTSIRIPTLSSSRLTDVVLSSARYANATHACTQPCIRDTAYRESYPNERNRRMVMTNTRAPLVLGYPTPAMESMIHDIRNDILFLRQWFDAPPERDLIHALTEVTPFTVLATLARVIESVEPALRVFLNYPTQRLS